MDNWLVTLYELCVNTLESHWRFTVPSTIFQSCGDSEFVGLLSELEIHHIHGMSCYTSSSVVLLDIRQAVNVWTIRCFSDFMVLKLTESFKDIKMPVD